MSLVILTTYHLQTYQLVTPNMGLLPKTIKYLGINDHQRRNVERTWKMANEFIEKGLNYTETHYSKHTGRPYLLKYSNELNIFADFTENSIGLRYTTSLINFHCKTQGFDAVCKYTVNIYFKIIQPKRTKIQKIEKITKNGGKWKEARMCKAKNVDYFQ